MIKQEHYPLLLHNTFGIEATANCFIEYGSTDELRELIFSDCITTPYLHIGGGSNLLFTKDFEGTILHSRIEGIKVLDETAGSVQVRVGAGVIWDDFVAYCVSKGWYGAENLSLIPGEVGASAIQNIGAYGVEVKDLIVAVETMNIRGEKALYPAEACAYAYRDSIFKQAEMKDVFVTYVRFRLSKKEQYTLDYGSIRQELERYPLLTLDVVRRTIIAIRESKLPDPKVMGNAGSFFKNPIVSREFFEELILEYPRMPFYELDDEQVKIPAAWLIDQCGWKGKKLGKAAVHDKQALVLVNRGGATGADIIALSDAVRASVQEKFQIDIHPEVNFIY
ncbi:MAG: UDP-N-acetylmuramate dehydrogenase [Bacteroides sp.]